MRILLRSFAAAAILLVTGASASADTWIGTAPFCSASSRDCALRGMDFVRASIDGDGARCITGHKVLCRPRAPLPDAMKHPFYVIAHRVNNLEVAEDAIAHGANAIEVDVRCRERGDFFLFHDITQRGSRFVPFLRGLVGVAGRHPHFALIIFDIKEICPQRPGDLSHGARLLNLIRANFSRATGVKVLLSVPNFADSSIFVPLGIPGPSSLASGEGAAIDQEHDFGAVSDVFRGRGIRRFAYGDGICVVCPGGGRVRDAVAGAVRNRAALGFRLVYVWTLADEDSMRDYIAMGVDGIFVNPSAIRELRGVLADFNATHRRARRSDNPFR